MDERLRGVKMKNGSRYEGGKEFAEVGKCSLPTA
jgi:hypothetical protein